MHLHALLRETEGQHIAARSPLRGFLPEPTLTGTWMRRDWDYSVMQRSAELLESVDVYFRALYACDVELLDSVFHAASTLFDVDNGAIVVDPYPKWREVVANRASPASVGQERDEEVIVVDWLSERAAMVRVRLRVLDSIFVDQLSFVDGEDGWRIVAKVWSRESAA